MVTHAAPVATATRAPPIKPFDEYIYVTLARDLVSDGVLYPVGTRGVIVQRHDDNIGYEVEFEAPRFTVVTLTANDIEAA